MAERAGGYALLVWSELEFRWWSLAVSEDRERLVDLRKRMSLCVPVLTRIIEAASADDDDVEAAGVVEPWPGHVAHLHHESYGIE